MYHLFHKLFAIAIRLNNWFLVLFSMLLVTGSSIVIYWLEPKTFDHRLFTAFWWVMTTVTTVGYGDYAPVTTGGRILAMMLYLVGIGLIGVVIGKIVDSFGTFKQRKEEGKLSYRGNEHFVLIGWSEKGKDATYELLSANEKNEVVLIDKLDRSPISHERFHYIQGNPTHDKTLSSANLQNAKAVLIFSPNHIDDPVLADGHTLLIASAIEHFSQQSKTNIYTIVEVINEHHVRNFQHAQVDEFILSNQLTSNMMAKVAMSKGVSQLFHQLLTAKGGADLHTFAKHPTWNTYGDAYSFFRSYGANLIADRNDFNIMRRLSEPLPKVAKLRVICDPDTYKTIQIELKK